MRLVRFISYTILEKLLTVRVVAFSVIMFLICWIYNEQIRQYAAALNYPAGIWVFPFLMGSYTFLIMFYFAAIYVNADIPFMQYSNMYRLLRSGRRNWAISQILMLFFRSFFLVCITFICSVITLLPNIELTMEWGKLLYNVGAGTVQINTNWKYFLYYEAMVHWTPIELISLTILISTLVVFFLSLFMFLISLFVNRLFAVVGATAMDFLLFFVLNAHPQIRNRLAFWVPTIWPQISRQYTPDVGYFWMPSVPYILTVSLVSIAVLSLLIIFRIRYVEFDWRNEDT